MKIRADRAELAEAVVWVAQAMPKKAAAPVMSGMRVKASGDTLTLYAFDYDTSHQASITAEVVTEGECLVSGSFLKDVLGSLKAEAVEIVLDAARLTLTAGRATYGVPVLPLEDYPTLPTFPEEVGETTAVGLQFLMSSVGHAVDTDDAIKTLLAVRLEASATDLTAAATNRFVLASAEVGWAGREFEANVPARAAGVAIKGLRGAVAVGYHDGHFGLSDATRTVTMRCFDGDYPKWRKLIRAEDSFSVEIDSATLLDAVKRAGQLVERNQAIVLTVRPGELEVSVDSEENGAGSEVMECDGEDSIVIAMNARFLADSIAAGDSARLVLGFGADPGKPVVLRPVDHPISLLVMPRRNV